MSGSEIHLGGNVPVELLCSGYLEWGERPVNCLLACKLAERGVRFIQLYHRGWDQHYNLPSDLRLQCRDVDQPAAALVRDLKQRGLLDDTWWFRVATSVAQPIVKGSLSQPTMVAIIMAVVLRCGWLVVAYFPD